MSDLSKVLMLEKFNSWLSEKVEIHFTEEDIRSSQVIEVMALSKNKNEERIPFSVVFLTDLKEAYYEQGTFKVVIPDQTEEFMFMVPIGVDIESGGMRYEVVFN